mmetsp:Transcript_23856/g.66116  ORF Transcript_23856/g.66116 Transcript_23856/m.66116 type:complete len:742 (-) Transcript_23856:80-2305(-)|eukprot:CAMPEP_0172360276 /NCGR_PEP_ID=MMETSP1060-20121228/4343_1 /TAXON_ID=37318 /ORGANISM="Pseudo-nitzschia pungens, Strain cf. cingulata" /LENGTH=741 /DNA_ID=CAMNT_0013082235 /DNA_START=153 /DNA_END=2378 /DNA_ORIENTATION=-
MSRDNSQHAENDNPDVASSTSRSPTHSHSDHLVVSRSSTRRKSLGRDGSGSSLLSKTKQQRAPDPPEALTSIGQHGPSRGSQRRVMRVSRSPVTKRESSFDDESNSSHGSSERKGDKVVHVDRSPGSPINRKLDRRDSSGVHRRRNGNRRSDSRSSEIGGKELRSPRERRKSLRSGGENGKNISRPSSASNLRSSRNRKLPSSASKLEELVDDSSSLSENRKGRSSSSSVGSSKHRSSSGKLRSESDKGSRPSRSGSARSERSPRRGRLETPNSSSSSSRKKFLVTEAEIRAVLAAPYSAPSGSGDDNAQSSSPNPDKRRNTRSKSTDVPDAHGRRSHGTHRLGSKKKMSRRASNEAEFKSERTERKPRVPPRRTRSDNDGNALDNYLQQDPSGKKMGYMASRSVVSSKSHLANKSLATTRSTQSRRRRHDVSAGKPLRPINTGAVDEENYSDDMNDSGFINGNHYEDYEDDHRSIDLDLATARDKFANQLENQKLQLHLNKTDELLYSVFPKHVANALRNGQKVEPENHELVTVFFSDIVGFTDISAKLDPLKISDMLDRLYNTFDALSEYHDVFKVETIGDAYMAVTNLTKEQPDHCKRIAEFAIDTIQNARRTLVDEDNPSMGFVNIRVGLHSGPVVSNVVGTRNPRYCLFGDTVNTASRMESNSQKNMIHCSEISANLLREQCPRMAIFPRGIIEVKGKGEMKTFWVNKEGSTDKRNGTIRSFMKSVRKNKKDEGVA